MLFRSDANRLMDLPKEGIQRAKEALGMFEQLGDIGGQARCLTDLTRLWQDDGQFDAAQEAAFRALDLLPETGKQLRVCDSHRTLGNIYRFKGETKKAIYHFEVALGIASAFNWHDLLFWVHYELAELFLGESGSDDAQAHIERAKLHTVNNIYYLGRVTELQAEIWYKQHRLEVARAEALRAADNYNKLGATIDMERCRELLRMIEEELNAPTASASNCELL